MKKNIKEFIDNDGYKVAQKFDQITNKIIKQTHYYPGGKNISSVHEYDPNIGKPIKDIYYQFDGQTIINIWEYDKNTGERIKATFYRPDGTVKYIINF
ncbi:DUF2963 domain-containing protein [Candidatus Phytoplasma rubi]|uniref:DUF2963 domain-containing protein n=1 Tax=Candidatus Phytoplasma rubi TaxID=399025 RepID=UPI0022865836|nr:DUF2963 domain-containing protein [Candidatus Phytoplasma rubi]